MTFVDREILDEVRSAFTEDRWKDLIQRMFAEAENARIELLALLKDGNISAIPVVAHRVAGSAISIGASALNLLFCEIETAAEGQENLQEVNALIGSLQICIERTEKAFQSL
jgi:HPt (histidine-containing phosphotransfer) domain-containing protein